VAFEVISSSPEATGLIGAAIGRLFQQGDVLCLTGPLGAGKTCLVQGVIKGLHPEASYPVRSPSFTIISEYPGPVPIYHVDLFRIEAPLVGAEIGLEDLLGSEGYCLIEWADRCYQWLPDERLDIDMSIEGPSTRRLSVVPKGGRWMSAEEQIRQAVLRAI
jgi:tRNA threonylcarbamoyladenosine biosynthesis protein TsaE